MTLDEAIKHAEEKSKCNSACADEHKQLVEWLKELKNFPRPVIRDGNGKLVKYYSLRDWYLKLQEEIFEVSESIMEDVHVEITAEELADLITVCISYLEYLGYDEKARSELFAEVNEKNEKRGYFKEC